MDRHPLDLVMLELSAGRLGAPCRSADDIVGSLVCPRGGVQEGDEGASSTRADEAASRYILLPTIGAHEIGDSPPGEPKSTRLEVGKLKDTVSGGLGNDTIYASDGDNVVNGDDGNDVVTAGFGTNTINGGVGTQQLEHGPGL
ncbi:MAG: hypothetical protein JJE05_09640 [Actinobacteria bacterium]|nr:hypothetical protein [Actinomycetota bacterium]